MMNKVQVVKNKNYTTISNEFLRDKSLSLKAKGLLATIMSLPADWNFSIHGFVEIIKEGETAVYSAIDELKENGYCCTEQARDDKVQIAGINYTFFENPDSLDSYLQDLENPHGEIPDVDNQGERTYSVNTIKEEEKNKEKDIKKEKELKKITRLEKFEELWVLYNRKGRKNKAKIFFDKLTDEETEMIEPHIKTYTMVRDKQFTQDFERYLRDKTFLSVIYGKNNNILYDPERTVTNEYRPQGYGIFYEEDEKCYYSMANFDGEVFDGYTDGRRPDGATLCLNNARGTIVWSQLTQTWIKQ